MDFQANKTLASSSTPPRNWEHDVFVSFRGGDVRTAFLSHILKEFRRKGINPFIDNGMKKGASISPELKRAIKGSKIAIVLLSKKYASSSWCLNELVKIIKCRKKIGQEVITIFYQIEPTDVKKQAGDFGKVFEETCEGKTSHVIQKWKEALTEVGTIVGYDSTKWVDEASAIEEVANDISKILNHMVPSHNLDCYIGMKTHMKKMKSLLRLDLEDEVRMIGIWGPPGIGKSTISRYIYDQLSNNFQLKAIMVNIKQNYPNPCFDEVSAQLQLQNDMLSKMINHKDIVITHLGAAQDRLKTNKVLLVLDDVDQLAQLVALAKDNLWFGPGSRIIIATEDKRVLLAHGIRMDHIYKVKYPSNEKAFQIFCMYAFPHKSPDDDFIELAHEVTYLVGNLPLGLKVMGSYFLRRPKHEWIEALPMLSSRLDGKIETILKFSYDALCDDEHKDLFLHIACFFNFYEVEKVEACLAESFTDVRQGIQVLAEKSLIYFDYGCIRMHNLLVQLGQEIVRKQSGKHQFVTNTTDIFEVLKDNTSITKSIVGISHYQDYEGKEFAIRKRAFEGMSNLQFLQTRSPCILSSSRCLINIPSNLRLLHWDYFPLKCWPTTVKLEFLVELEMPYSKLKKLWEGIKPLPRLKWMDLSCSKNLRKLPNLSTATSLMELNLSECLSLVKLPSSIENATNLQILNLNNCSSLVELPSSIGKATNLQRLYLMHCSSLVKLPFSIGNATNLQSLDLMYCSSLVKLPFSIGNAINLQTLNLSYCSSLVELPCSIGNATNLRWLSLCHCSSLVEIPSSIGNLHKLEKFLLHGCSKLEFLPTNINMERLEHLKLTNCFLLKTFPEISTNIKYLRLTGTAVKEVPSSIRSWSHLEELCMSYSERLLEMPQALDTITELDLTDSEEIQELGIGIKGFTRLSKLVLNRLRKLVSRPQHQDSLLFLEEIQELGTWIKGFTRLYKLVLNGMRNLVSLPQLPDSLEYLDAENCESLERLDCSFSNPNINLNFRNCFKLNQEARDLIIQTSTHGEVILPGREVPTYFNYRASGNSLTVKLNENEPLGTSRIYRACVLLVNEGVWDEVTLSCCVASKYKIGTSFYRTYKGSKEETSSENLFIFNIRMEEVTSTEFVLEFCAKKYCNGAYFKLEIKECGVVQF